MAKLSANEPFRRRRRPTSPGAILREFYLEPRHISVTAFAEAIGLSRKHVSSIVNGSAAITPETAERFARVLGTTARFWLNLQIALDLYDAELKLGSWKPKALGSVAA